MRIFVVLSLFFFFVGEMKIVWPDFDSKMFYQSVHKQYMLSDIGRDTVCAGINWYFISKKCTCIHINSTYRQIKSFICIQTHMYHLAAARETASSLSKLASISDGTNWLSLSSTSQGNNIKLFWFHGPMFFNDWKYKFQETVNQNMQSPFWRLFSAKWVFRTHRISFSGARVGIFL